MKYKYAMVCAFIVCFNITAADRDIPVGRETMIGGMEGRQVHQNPQKSNYNLIIENNTSIKPMWFVFCTSSATFLKPVGVVQQASEIMNDFPGGFRSLIKEPEKIGNNKVLLLTCNDRIQLNSLIAAIGQGKKQSSKLLPPGLVASKLVSPKLKMICTGECTFTIAPAVEKKKKTKKKPEQATAAGAEQQPQPLWTIKFIDSRSCHAPEKMKKTGGRSLSDRVKAAGRSAKESMGKAGTKIKESANKAGSWFSQKASSAKSSLKESWNKRFGKKEATEY